MPRAVLVLADFLFIYAILVILTLIAVAGAYGFGDTGKAFISIFVVVHLFGAAKLVLFSASPIRIFSA